MFKSSSMVVDVVLPFSASLSIRYHTAGRALHSNVYQNEEGCVIVFYPVLSSTIPRS